MKIVFTKANFLFYTYSPIYSQQAYVSPCIASATVFRWTMLEAPWSSASFAPAVPIISAKIKNTMCHGFGFSGCIREKSAS
jgi:hypothetical protein